MKLKRTIKTIKWLYRRNKLACKRPQGPPKNCFFNYFFVFKDTNLKHTTNSERSLKIPGIPIALISIFFYLVFLVNTFCCSPSNLAQFSQTEFRDISSPVYLQNKPKEF